MKTIRLLLFLFAIALVPFAARSDDKIASIDAAKSQLSVYRNGALKIYRIMAFTEIAVNGAKASIGQLRPGMTVALTVDANQAALKIVASGLGVATAPSDKPRPFFERSPAADPARRILIKIRIDGSDRIFFRDGQLWIEHLKTSKPTAITINGAEWTPMWKGETTEPFTGFNPPPVAIGQSRVTINQTLGRNKAKLEPPSSRRGNATTVLIEDNQSGADIYEFQLSW